MATRKTSPKQGAAASAVSAPSAAPITKRNPRPLRVAAAQALQHFEQLPDDALIDVRLAATLAGSGVSTMWRKLKAPGCPLRVVRLSARATRFTVGSVRSYLRGEGQR